MTVNAYFYIAGKRTKVVRFVSIKSAIIAIGQKQKVLAVALSRQDQWEWLPFGKVSYKVKWISNLDLLLQNSIFLKFLLCVLQSSIDVFVLSTARPFTLLNQEIRLAFERSLNLLDWTF